MNNHYYRKVDGEININFLLERIRNLPIEAKVLFISPSVKDLVFTLVECENNGKKVELDILGVLPEETDLTVMGLLACTKQITKIEKPYDSIVYFSTDAYEGVRAVVQESFEHINVDGEISGLGWNRVSHSLAISDLLPLSQIVIKDDTWSYKRRAPIRGFFYSNNQDDSKDFRIFIPYCNRFDLLERAINSVIAHKEKIVIIDQSDIGIEDQWGISIFRWTEPRHFVKMQNWIQQYSYDNHLQHFIFMHNDAECAEHTVKTVMDTITSAEDDWGVVFTAYDAFCVFNAKNTKRIGCWDETFLWYVADCDYYNRVKLLGYKALECPHSGIRHLVSQTLRNLSPAEANAVNHNHSWAKAHYAHKWGTGTENGIVYKIPYNGHP